MNMIPAVICQLLFEHDTVVVPGLGMFVKHYDGAKVNVITNYFERPSTTLTFDPQQRGEDSVLLKALAAKNGIAEDEARQVLNRFVADCFTELTNGKEVVLEGLGSLSMGTESQLEFHPDDDANFNGDAFGLGDFTPAPVYAGNRPEGPKPSAGIAAEEGPDDEHSFRHHRRRTLLLTVLSLLLIVPAVLILLFFLEVIHFDFNIKPRPVKVPQVYFEPDTAVLAQMVCYYPQPRPEADTMTADETLDSTTVEQPAVTTVEQPVVTTVEPPVVTTVEQPENPVVMPAEPYKINIIGGCFSQKENAESLVKQIQGEGFERAYVLVRGKMYYVSYGGFATIEEAKEELNRVKADSNNKAWILNK